MTVIHFSWLSMAPVNGFLCLNKWRRLSKQIMNGSIVKHSCRSYSIDLTVILFRPCLSGDKCCAEGGQQDSRAHKLETAWERSMGPELQHWTGTGQWLSLSNQFKIQLTTTFFNSYSISERDVSDETKECDDPNIPLVHHKGLLGLSTPVHMY